MADYKVVDAQQLDGDLTVLADAIRERAGSEGKMAFPNGMAQMVKSIPTGGVELPTLENPVTEAEVFLGKEYIDGNGQMATGSFTIDNELTEQDALILQISNALRNKAAATDPGTLPPLENPASSSDMATGKELYDQDGNVVTGTLAEITSGAALSASDNATVAGSASTGIRIKAQRSDGSDYILRSGAYLMAAAPADQFGDAAAADVAKGKTFTSAEGLLVEGTHECDPGLQLAPLANPAGAADIVSGKALYDSDGNVIPGSLYEVLEGKTIAATEFVRVYEHSSGDIHTWATQNVGDAVVRKNSIFRTVAPASAFGDATPDQVAKGATFTSAAGYLMEGTHECEGGVTLPELGDTAAQPTDMAAGKVLYDDAGNPVTGTLVEATEGILINSKSDAVLGGSAGAPEFNVSGIYLKSAIGDNTKGVIMRPGSRMAVRNVPTSLFGNATPNQVAKGATFTSAAGLLMEGTMEAASGDGLAVTKGNTSSPTIETGLSSIDYFVLMATGFSSAGLMQLLYRKPNNAISYILCTSYSYSTMKTELNHASMASSTLFTIDGGTVTWNGTGTSAFMSGESYMWLAFGTE